MLPPLTTPMEVLLEGLEVVSRGVTSVLRRRKGATAPSTLPPAIQVVA